MKAALALRSQGLGIRRIAGEVGLGVGTVLRLVDASDTRPWSLALSAGRRSPVLRKVTHPKAENYDQLAKRALKRMTRKHR